MMEKDVSQIERLTISETVSEIKTIDDLADEKEEGTNAYIQLKKLLTISYLISNLKFSIL